MREKEHIQIKVVTQLEPGTCLEILFLLKKTTNDAFGGEQAKYLQAPCSQSFFRIRIKIRLKLKHLLLWTFLKPAIII